MTNRILLAFRFAILATVATPLTTIPAYAQPADELPWYKKREFIYFLPKTVAVATAGQRLVRCPTASDHVPGIETEISIVEAQVPDPASMVRVDGRSGFLVKRTTKLVLRPNGTLEAFNASTEGQGGDLAVAMVKAAVTAGSFALGSGVPTIASGASRHLFSTVRQLPASADKSLKADPPFSCRSEAAALLDQHGKIDSSIALLEKLVEQDEASPAQLLLLTSRRQQQADLRKELTLTSTPAVFDFEGATEVQAAFNAPSAAGPKLVIPIPAVDYGRWFAANGPGAASSMSPLVGSNGFVAKLAPDMDMMKLLGGDGSRIGPGAQPYLFYRRPIQASLTVNACKPGRPSSPSEPCEIDESVAGLKASASKKFMMPQLSGLYAIPIGRGSMFGTRQASAKFDASGSPIELEYGSGSAGADMSKLLGAASEGAVTLRDAQAAAWKRAADEATSRKTYEEAVKALEKLHEQ